MPWAWILCCLFLVSVYTHKTVADLSWSPLHLHFIFFLTLGRAGSWLLCAAILGQKPGDKQNCQQSAQILSPLPGPSPTFPISSHGCTTRKCNSLVAIPFHLASFNDIEFSYNKDWFLNNHLLFMYLFFQKEQISLTSLALFFKKLACFWQKIYKCKRNSLKPKNALLFLRASFLEQFPDLSGSTFKHCEIREKIWHSTELPGRLILWALSQLLHPLQASETRDVGGSGSLPSRLCQAPGGADCRKRPGQDVWGPGSAPQLISCRTLGKSTNFCGFIFPFLKMIPLNWIIYLLHC